MIRINAFQNVKGAFVGKEFTPDFPQIKDFILLKQVHGDSIHLIQEPAEVSQVHLREGDALLTTLKNIPIAVKTADCVPIIIFHPEVVGVVHAGWRGTRLKILEKVLIKIRDELKKDLSEIHLAIGPAICGECYEVGEEVAREFWNEGSIGLPRSVGANNYLPLLKPDILSLSKDEVGKYFLNLKLANQFIAESCGVLTESITVYPDCTLCNSNTYHSYRYETQKGLDKEGRNYSWVMRI